MPNVSFWNDERYAIVQALRAKGVSWRDVAIECNALWGTAFTADAVRTGQRCAPASLRPPEVSAASPGVPTFRAPAETRAPDAHVNSMPPPPPPDDDVEVLHVEGVAQAPAVHTSRTRGESYLIISDTQEPYSAPGALPFILAVAREFGVDLSQPNSAYHVGDEVDFLNFSRFLRSPEAPHTPNQELQAVRDRLKPWYEAIPYLRLCKSNHGDRILRRAADAGLPSQIIRAHRDIIEAPPGWEWANEWRVQASKQPFLVEHGHHGGQSTAASRQRPAWNGISTTWGHMHAQAGVWHVKTHGQEVWGLCVGSLIDRDQVAFEYGKPNTWQPWLGVGVVLDGGRVPLLIPYGGRWP